EIVARDVATRPGGDVITWASFGRAPAFESPSVDPTATDLAAALNAALGRNPTEIVLYSDGRGDPGNPLFLFRDRKGPVHVFTLPGTGRFNVDLDVQDACSENNHARGEVLPRSDKRKILFLSAKAPALSDFEVDVAQKIETLAPYEAVVLDNVDLSPAELQTL